MADIPDLDDPRLDLLVGIYAQASLALASSLDDILTFSGAQRFRIFQQIQKILADLAQQTDAWSKRFIKEFLEESDKLAKATLLKANPAAVFVPEVDEQAVALLSNHLTGTLSKAAQSSEAFLSKVFRSSALERTFPKLAFEVQRDVAVGLAAVENTREVQRRIANRLRKQFRDGAVSIIGKGGRRFSFPLNFYAGMVARGVKSAAGSSAVLLRAREAGHDLVRVSSNPSKNGDWCDAYRGRVFSLSGAHPLYVPLNRTPNGGPPFHPWCRHVISIFIPELHSEAENQAFAAVNQEFLLQGNETDPNRLARAWWREQRSG
jgi:hypothetical protein